MTQYWGGGGGTRHFFLLTLYNFKNIWGTRAPNPLALQSLRGFSGPSKIIFRRESKPLTVKLNNFEKRLWDDFGSKLSLVCKKNSSTISFNFMPIGHLSHYFNNIISFAKCGDI